MNNSTPLDERKPITKGLTLFAAAGIFLVLLVAATALTFASNNPQAGNDGFATKITQPG